MIISHLILNILQICLIFNLTFFIISDKSEKELIDEYGGQSYIIPLGIILSAIGFSMILTSLGYI